jgi:importin subunit alpha-1|tara:strand:- start:432 stop:1979 length:1548 start_codon:yes stop_codon:yes gene_type:complete
MATLADHYILVAINHRNKMSSAAEKEKERKAAFKKSIDVQKSRRSRMETQVSIRKKKKEERMNKKRRKPIDVGPAVSGEWTEDVSALSNTDEKIVILAIRKLRKRLSVERDPPIDLFISCGALKTVAAFLYNCHNPSIIFEAMWCITNVTSGSSKQAMAVVNMGIVPQIMKMSASPNVELADQCIWCLGNLAGDSINIRDLLLSIGGMELILERLSDKSPISTVRIATWCIANLCRGKPRPSLSITRKALIKLNAILTFEDGETVTDALWALSYMTDGPNEQIQVVLNNVALDRIVPYMAPSWRSSIQIPALRVMGNVVSGNDLQTQHVIECGAVPSIVAMLNSHKSSIRKETCWVLSNIAAGSAQQIQLLVDCQVFTPLRVMMNTESYTIVKEIAWIVSNACEGGNAAQISHIMQVGFIPPICSLLNREDVEEVKMALGILFKMLRTDASMAVDKLEDCQGEDAISNLQCHEDPDIYHCVVELIEEFFSAEEENDQLQGSSSPQQQWCLKDAME